MSGAIIMTLEPQRPKPKKATILDFPMLICMNAFEKISDKKIPINSNVIVPTQKFEQNKNKRLLEFYNTVQHQREWKTTFDALHQLVICWSLMKRHNMLLMSNWQRNLLSADTFRHWSFVSNLEKFVFHIRCMLLETIQQLLYSKVFNPKTIIQNVQIDIQLDYFSLWKELQRKYKEKLARC